MSLKPAIYKSICQTCVYRTHPTMISGYSVTSCKCDNCGRNSDLALVQMQKGEEVWVIYRPDCSHYLKTFSIFNNGYSSTFSGDLDECWYVTKKEYKRAKLLKEILEDYGAVFEMKLELRLAYWEF